MESGNHSAQGQDSYLPSGLAVFLSYPSSAFHSKSGQLGRGKHILMENCRGERLERMLYLVGADNCFR